MYVLHRPTTSMVHRPSSTPVRAKANGTGSMELRQRQEAGSHITAQVSKLRDGKGRGAKEGGGVPCTFLGWTV